MAHTHSAFFDYYKQVGLCGRFQYQSFNIWHGKYRSSLVFRLAFTAHELSGCIAPTSESMHSLGRDVLLVAIRKMLLRR